MSEYSNAISLKNVTKKYDGFTLDHVSFDVPKGSIMGFIGQNGAGKTTTIRSLLNIIGIDEGTVQIMGLDHLQYEMEIKKRIAVIFDECPFHDVFNAMDMAKIFEGLYPEWNNEVYNSYLERFGLPRKKSIGQFSKGMKMKLQIACGLSHNAELLVMDEATTGLDPIVRDEILHIFMEYIQDGERSILMSSHITSDIEKIADSVTFINKGKLLVSGYKDDILDTHGMIKCSIEDYRKLDRTNIISARINAYGTEVMVSDRNAPEKYRGLLLEPVSLEDIMLFYVNRERGEWS